MLKCWNIAGRLGPREPSRRIFQPDVRRTNCWLKYWNIEIKWSSRRIFQLAILKWTLLVEILKYCNRISLLRAQPSYISTNRPDDELLVEILKCWNKVVRVTVYFNRPSWNGRRWLKYWNLKYELSYFNQRPKNSIAGWNVEILKYRWAPGPKKAQQPYISTRRLENELLLEILKCWNKVFELPSISTGHIEMDIVGWNIEILKSSFNI